MKYVK